MNPSQDEGFYVTERKLSNGTASRAATDGGGAGFGRPVPIQLPTPREVEKDTEGFVSTINKLTSPVFFSTTQDGQVIQGLGGIPMSRPLLLIGNHQLFAAGRSLHSQQTALRFLAYNSVLRRLEGLSSCHKCHITLACT